ncbi:MAG: 2-amino-4-hydroxy-6-hydroxymethyldihydropteridine diphosphokinase [Nitrospiraceae bacterium]|nr:2-amino-4-hydroxy-6-hydroxymethyldihydropteridine diphosphokinase [Nitrospiraceae bacterium]
MARAFVSVGSNIDPETNVRAALLRLSKETDLRAISTIYLTEPLGRQGQPPFYNCVIEIETPLPPAELKFGVLRNIEAGLGRRRSDDKFAPRTIDLDLILYDDLVMTTPELTLPDPEILERPFLAIALSEIAPGLVLPGSQTGIGEAAAKLSRTGMQPLRTYTDRIRKEIRL